MKWGEFEGYLKASGATDACLPKLKFYFVDTGTNLVRLSNWHLFQQIFPVVVGGQAQVGKKISWENILTILNPK